MTHPADNPDQPPPPVFSLGLDLGQASDSTALSIAAVSTQPVQIVPGMAPKMLPVYEVGHLQRFPLGTAYTAIVKQLKAILERPELASHETTLVIDYTGVGRAVGDIFDDADMPHIRVSIHGGDSVSHQGNHYRVPKRDLVGAVQATMGTHRLKIADSLPEAATLRHEMQNFRVKIDPATAHDSYSHWRERDHDDLLLSLALVCWWGESQPPPSYWGRFES